MMDRRVTETRPRVCHSEPSRAGVTNNRYRPHYAIQVIHFWAMLRSGASARGNVDWKQRFFMIQPLIIRYYIENASSKETFVESLSILILDFSFCLSNGKSWRIIFVQYANCLVCKTESEHWQSYLNVEWSPVHVQSTLHLSQLGSESKELTNERTALHQPGQLGLSIDQIVVPSLR